MSVTQTIHFVCDGCGNRSDVEQERPTQRAYPEGWAPGPLSMWGDYCSEPCLRQGLVAKAITVAAEAFASTEHLVTA